MLRVIHARAKAGKTERDKAGCVAARAAIRSERRETTLRLFRSDSHAGSCFWTAGESGGAFAELKDVAFRVAHAT